MFLSFDRVQSTTFSASSNSIRMVAESILTILLLSVFANGSLTKLGCQEKCGNVTLPYPFGIGKECYLESWADVICNTTYRPPKPFIFDRLEVVKFSLEEVRIKNKLAASCYNQNGEVVEKNLSQINLDRTPYTFSTKNEVTVIGCDTYVVVNKNDTQNHISSCDARCTRENNVVDGSCYGNGCCRVSIRRGLQKFSAEVGSMENHSKIWSFNDCGVAFLGEKGNYTFKVSDVRNRSYLRDIPVVLNFAIGKETCKEAKQNISSYACKNNSDCYNSMDGNGYICRCNPGYEGNPYLEQGCQDVNECEDPIDNPCIGICINAPGSFKCSCPRNSRGDGRKDGTGSTKKNKHIPVLHTSLGLGFGILFLLVGGSWIQFVINKRRRLKLREKFFQRNGGLLLRRRISSLNDGGADSTKNFTSEELKLATNNYDNQQILGSGGFGIVYKGVLPDMRVVAIKKSRIVVESQLGQFLNELIILSQINHRNVVKLLGCCLETQVPTLVYEFISNGTLSYHLHKRGGRKMPWEDRMRIAAETAGALSYLHSAASIPIIHRDFKSDNILLDDYYTAKVADFGLSRMNPLDESQINTLVQGTLGYLDPEYFQSGQLTEKSDVYSFGVVLAELLTGEKPISIDRSEEHRNLATYFIVLFKQNTLFQILEPEIVNDGNTRELLAVAELTQKCLCLRGEERPLMKEVVAELEGLRGFKKRPCVDHDQADLYSYPSTSYSNEGTSGQDTGQYTSEKISPYECPQMSL